MEIYKHIVVLRNLPLTVESTFAYDDYILVGTKEGHLLMYKLDIKAKTPSEYELQTHLQRSTKQFSRKPITQIEAIPEHRILVSLSDSLISIHNLDKFSFPLINTLTRTKGATSFALDVNQHRTLTGEIQVTVRLAVIVKYQVQFYYWKNNNFHELRPNIKLNDIARTIVWHGPFLYVGFRTQYVQVSVDAGTIKVLFPILTEPLMLSLCGTGKTIGVLGSSSLSSSSSLLLSSSSNNNYGNSSSSSSSSTTTGGINTSFGSTPLGGLALCRDKQTFIFDAEAKPLLDYPITWSEQPLSIADDSLFLLAVLSSSDSSSSGSSTTSTSSTVEVLTSNGAKILFIQKITFPTPSASISKPLRHIKRWRNRSGQLIVSSESDVVLLKSVSPEQQIRMLQSEKHFELALKIVELYSPPPLSSSMYDNNDNNDYHDDRHSMSGTSSTLTLPMNMEHSSIAHSNSNSRIATPYGSFHQQQQQPQLSGSLISNTSLTGGGGGSNSGDAFFSTFDSSIIDPSTETERLKLRIRNLQALDKFGRGEFKEAITIFQSLKTDPSYVIGLYPDLLPEDFRSKLNYPTKLPKLEGAILEHGLLVLIDYLLEVRRKIKDDISKLDHQHQHYHHQQHHQPTNVHQSTSTLNTSVNNKTPSDLFRLQSIIDTSLLKCYLETNDALVAPLLRIPDNHCHLEETERALRKRQKYAELVILYRTKGLHRQALELLQRQALYNDEQRATINRRRLIQYLQELTIEHIDLIFEFSEWILRDHPQEALEIFIDDTVLELEQDCKALPREQVLAYLERISPTLVIPYLEHCIFEWKETRSAFHDSLINKYREKIRILMAEYQLESLNQQRAANTIEILYEDDLPSSPSTIDISTSMSMSTTNDQTSSIRSSTSSMNNNNKSLQQRRSSITSLKSSSNSTANIINNNTNDDNGGSIGGGGSGGGIGGDKRRRSMSITSNSSTATAVREYYLRPEPGGCEPGDLGFYRRKLMHLLEESDHYSTETLSTYLLHDGLFDERAIVMGKIGAHQEAIVIYVHVLQDLQRAEEYCAKQYTKWTMANVQQSQQQISSNSSSGSGSSDNKQQTKTLKTSSSVSSLSTTTTATGGSGNGVVKATEALPTVVTTTNANATTTNTTTTSSSLATYSAKDVFLLLFQQCLKISNPTEIHLGPQLMQHHQQQQQQLHVDDNGVGDGDGDGDDHLTPSVRIALTILSRHSTKIDLNRALQHLPSSLPLAALSIILIQSMEHHTSRKNYLQILRQLLHAQRLRTHQSRIRMEQTTRLLVTSMDICKVCMKKIGKSVFVRYINTDLVHLGCREQYEHVNEIY